MRSGVDQSGCSESVACCNGDEDDEDDEMALECSEIAISQSIAVATRSLSGNRK